MWWPVQVVAETFLSEPYVHPEDFFFRTVHLGTECWAYIATRRMRSAKQARHSLLPWAQHELCVWCGSLPPLLTRPSSLVGTGCRGA